jgi:hypothetical protein
MRPDYKYANANLEMFYIGSSVNNDVLLLLPVVPIIYAPSDALRSRSFGSALAKIHSCRFAADLV